MFFKVMVQKNEAKNAFNRFPEAKVLSSSASSGLFNQLPYTLTSYFMSYNRTSTHSKLSIRTKKNGDSDD